MDHFLDIKLTPDAELQGATLLNMVYTKLHKALFDLHSTALGVSFPEAGESVGLGLRLRLHGEAQALHRLDTAWLGKLAVYCVSSAVRPVPHTVNAYRTISRKQLNMSPSKMKRLMARGTLAPDALSRYKDKLYGQTLTEPFLALESASSGRHYKRHIQMGKLQSHPTAGPFDAFGLSKTATIPWF